MKRLLLVAALLGACGDDGTEADRLGIGAQCEIDDHCLIEDDQVCLLGFKGGYCGRADCESDLDCPGGAACVVEADTNYCFRVCADKVECNANRDAENEANCSSSVEFVDGTQGRKACLPPTG